MCISKMSKVVEEGMVRSTRQHSRFSGRTITLIENDKALVELLAYSLTHAGYKVLSFDAMELPKEVPGDLIVVEVLAFRKWVELIKRIRKQKPRHVPILILTARGEESDRIKGLSAGASDYISKPFSPAELNARIEASFRIAEPHHFPNQLSGLNVSQKMFVLSHRVERVADGITQMRLNSTSELVGELRDITTDLNSIASDRKQLPVLDEKDLKKEGLRALPVISKIYDVVGSERGAEMLVAGAVAGIVGIGGWPTVTAYSLSLAAWMGKDAFMKALEKASKGKSS
ncbi:MAG: response regulator [Planctomycetota bacterium]